MASTSNDRINGITTSVAVKAPVAAVATTNITLSGEQTVGGVAVTAGDRVLVTAQTSSVDNGIYDVSTGDWTRSADFDGNRDVKQGTLVVVASATAGTPAFYWVTAADPITVGTTAITFDEAPNLNVAELAGNNTFSGTNNFTGTLQVAGTAIAEFVADTVGAMVVGNTETSMTVTYDDADNTLDFVVNAATTVQSGTTRYATGAEVVTGSLTVAAVTPGSLTSDQSLPQDASLSGTTSVGATFYHTLPGGLCLQGGPTAVVTANSSVSVTFGKAMSELYSVTATPITTAVTMAENVAAVDGATGSGFTLYNGDASDRRFYWMAMGKV